MPLLPPGMPLFEKDGSLSRAYLLHRGYCCENGCRNCPYGFTSPAAVGESMDLSVQTANAYLPRTEQPRRIISLCPSNTEILSSLGLLPRIVGIDDYSDWPPEVRDLPRLGPDLNIAMERVQELRPDLIVASLSVPGMERNVTRLRELGLPYIVLDPHSLGDIWQSVRSVGAVTGVEETAEQVITELQARIQRVRRQMTDVTQRPRFYWEWWPKPLIAPGGRNWLTSLSELAGGVNITAEIDADAARPTPEEVAAAQPDFIFLVWTGVARHKVRPEVVLRRPGWERIPAVQKGEFLFWRRVCFAGPLLA
jgi:iron complex transport system substrate-binding protein